MPLTVLARLAFHPGDGAAGDGHPLAAPGVARVLDVEEPSPTPGPAAYQQRAARAHREERNREPALGRRLHRGRATRARLRGERGDGEVLSAEGAAATAVPVLANLSRQPPPAALGCGLLVHFNVTAHPTAPWVWRQLLEATPWGPQQPRYLIRDRDRSYGGAFIYKARAIGIKTVLTVVRAPKPNAIAERVLGTLRRECLDHLIIVNERHLRLVLREYVAHYNHVRAHQALALCAPDDRRPRSPPRSEGQVVGRPILGGRHHEYERLAA